MNTLTRLELPDAGVTDLTGAGYAANLRIVNLAGNFVSDLSPVRSGEEAGVGWRALQYLMLDRNQVSDLRPLTWSLRLQGLSADYNAVTDVRPLNNLTSLEFLSIDGGPNNPSVPPRARSLYGRRIRLAPRRGEPGRSGGPAAGVRHGGGLDG